MTPQRAIAVMTVYECLILFGVDVLNGKALAEAWEESITEDLWLIIDKRALNADELHALSQNVVPLPEEAPGSSISTWAKQHAGKLLGHGEHWYRKQEKKYPRLQRDSSRISPATSQRPKSHPGEFDRFTRYERKFLSLPEEAQSSILAAVMTVMESESELVSSPDGKAQWKFRGNEQALESALDQRAKNYNGRVIANAWGLFLGPVCGYFRRPAEERDDVKYGGGLIPPELKQCVSRTITKMPDRLSARVRAMVCRRYPGNDDYTSHLRVDWPLPPLGAPKRSSR